MVVLLDFVFVAFLLIVTFLGVRRAERSNSTLVRSGVGLVFVLLMFVGWLNYGSAVERHISVRNLISIFLPLVVLGAFFKWNRNLPPGMLVKYFAMPLGFYVSTLLMFDGARQNSQADIINSMFPAVVAAFLSAACLNVSDARISQGRLPWSVEILIAALILVLISFLTVSGDWFAPFYYRADWMMVLGLIGSLYLFLGKGGSVYEKLGDAALYSTLLVIALNTIMYMDLYDAYNTAEQIESKNDWVQRCSDDPEDISCEDLREEESYSEEEYLWIGVSNLLSPLICMLGIYLLSVLIAITNNQTEKIVRRNWHLAEGFVFVIFVYFAPFSMLEFGS